MNRFNRLSRIPWLAILVAAGPAWARSPEFPQYTVETLEIDAVGDPAAAPGSAPRLVSPRLLTA